MISMKKHELFNSVRLPARLDMEQTADLLGFQKHDIPVLIKAKLISPLGSPAPNAPKWFAFTIVQSVRLWLSSRSEMSTV